MTSESEAWSLIGYTKALTGSDILTIHCGPEDGTFYIVYLLNKGLKDGGCISVVLWMYGGWRGSLM